MHAFINNQIDYCNALLSVLPRKSISCLQLRQNSAARVLTESGIEEVDNISSHQSVFNKTQSLIYTQCLMPQKVLKHMHWLFLCMFINLALKNIVVLLELLFLLLHELQFLILLGELTS